MSPLLYLASGSPRRHQLLTQLNIPFTVVRPNVTEQQQPNELAADYVCRLARDKARAGGLMAALPLPVLAGDTIVVLDDRVLEKPNSQTEGLAMLRQLSGRSHQVLTAMALLNDGQLSEVLVSTEVCFRALTEQDIESYWASGEPQDKAGGYGIQGRGGRFVQWIHGSYSSVVGLPLVETEALLSEAGLLSR